jgi:hypothetical protein
LALKRIILVETNVSNLVITGVLSQHPVDNILLPIAYFSRKPSPEEINYKIYDKELLTIIYTFKEWCPLLEGFPQTIEVISDHRNLTYLATNHLLNYHQICRSKFHSHFDFKIHYRPEKAHGKADVLTHYRQGSEDESDLL